MSSDAVVVTELMQLPVGSFLPQLCVGVGDLQMRFNDGSQVSFTGEITVDGGLPVEALSLEGPALLLPMLNGDVTVLSAADSGTLTLVVGAATLTCPADPQYESWNYSGADGTSVICLPGGEFGIWDKPARP